MTSIHVTTRVSTAAILVILLMISRTISFQRGRNGRLWYRAVSMASCEGVEVTIGAGGTTTGHRKKRKVAIICSFLGSKFHGLQMDSNSPYETIELHVSQSLNKIGCVIESNQNDLSKIGWSRSSRTDKGVHAARIVLSGKLEIDEENWLEEDGRLPKLAALIDKELPDDIKCLAAIKMNQGFRAREAGHYREYEYLFPLGLLLKEHLVEGREAKSKLPRTVPEAIERLNKALMNMEGSRSFHNFHKLSPKTLKETQRGDEKVKILSSKTEPISIGSTSRSMQDRHYFFDPWIKRDRSVQEKTRTVIYTCRASTKPVSFDGVDMVRVCIKGQSFLLHQIRLMMGCAILIARGTIPAMTLELALSTPYHVLFPMAPAQGLVLTNVGFNRNCNGQSIALDPSLCDEMDRILMTSAEWNRSENFKLNEIYRQVAQDWSSDSYALADTFLTHCDRYHVPQSLIEGEWARLLEETVATSGKNRESKNQKENVRVLKNLHDFREYCLLEDERFQRSDGMDMWLKSNERWGNRRYPKSPFRIQPVPHKALLPNTLSTALVCHFKCTPGGILLGDALRAIATFVVINPNMCEKFDAEQLFAFVVEKAGEDGLSFWQRQIKHELIV